MKFLWIILVILPSLNVPDVGGRDLLAKFDTIAKRFKNNFTGMVEAERKKMKAEIAAYNVEKERMKGFTVSNDDIIYLNIGGEKMATKRSTVRQFNRSLLATMFSGRWAKKLVRDKDGRVFLDLNPKHFGWILNYLRAKKLETAHNHAELPKIPPEQVKDFNNLVEYLGLEKEFKTKDYFDFKLHSSGVSIKEDGAVASKGSSDGHQYVLGANIYKDGKMRWLLKLQSFKNNHWIYVGILKSATSIPSNDLSYDWSGSYGWAFGDSMDQVYTNGKASYNSALRGLWKQGDTVELVLDCAKAKLSLFTPAGRAFHHSLPSSATWKFHVNLYKAFDQVHIV